MKFHSSVPKELQSLLANDLKRYEKEMPMSREEAKEVQKWVQAGNSPYVNGWYITTESGVPMDYISAKRILESGACLVAEYDTVNDNPILIIQDEQDEDTTDEDLPF